MGGCNTLEFLKSPHLTHGDMFCQDIQNVFIPITVEAKFMTAKRPTQKYNDLLNMLHIFKNSLRIREVLKSNKINRSVKKMPQHWSRARLLLYSTEWKLNCPLIEDWEWRNKRQPISFLFFIQWFVVKNYWQTGLVIRCFAFSAWTCSCSEHDYKANSQPSQIGL